MKTRIFALLTLLLSLIILPPGCTRDNLPEGLEWTVIKSPARFPLMNGKTALVYEIMVKNSSIDSYTFESVEVKGGSDVLLSLSGPDLDEIISVYHSQLKSLNAGETAFLFIWVEMASEMLPPETLKQTIRFAGKADQKTYTKELMTEVSDAVPVILSAPLMARRYAAVGAPSNDSYHRRTVNYLDEKFWTSDRYAIDFIGLDDGERYRQGRQNTNSDYFGYQDVVYSATAGEVVSLIDTIAENVPPQVPEINPSALYRAGGNQLVIKASAGVYVFYGHMVRGSIDLKVGDKVEAGQPIGRLGNSGNSDAPQLHLQVSDGPDPLRSHGIPWVFDRFTLHGYITGYDYVNGLIKVDYLNIQQEVDSKNIRGDAVVGFE